MSTTTAVKTTWGLDTAHSEIHFKVKHMMVSTVTGSFNDFSGEVISNGDDFADADISFVAVIDSIDTRSKQRDEHLKSEDFFNAASYPTLRFQSKKFGKKEDGTYELIGDLTIRGEKREVSLRTEYHGTVVDPYGQTKAGFEIRGLINRKDFGLKWSAVTEAGGVVVSDEVRLEMNVQLVKQA